MSESRRRGPGTMTHEQLSSFLDVSRWAALCTEGPDGALEVAPVWIASSSEQLVELISPAGDERDEVAMRGCLVADEFESYEGIRGAILRGVVSMAAASRPGGPARATFSVTQAHGFSFEATTTSL